LPRLRALAAMAPALDAELARIEHDPTARTRVVATPWPPPTCRTAWAGSQPPTTSSCAAPRSCRPKRRRASAVSPCGWRWRAVPRRF
jgi:hypothetical protein